MNDRIVYFGRNKDFDLTLFCYDLFLEFLKKTGHQLVMTVVSDDHHGDRDTLESKAQKHQIPWMYAPDNDVNNPEFVQTLRDLQPTLCITVQFPAIYKKDLIEVPTKAMLNVHRGWPLRGGAIDERTIYQGIKEYFVILHHITTGIDNGNIVGKVSFPIRPDEDGYTLVPQADKAAVELFQKSFLPLLGKPVPAGEVQDVSKTIYGAKGSLSNRIDWNVSAVQIERLVRAFHHPRKSGACVQTRSGLVYIDPPLLVVPAKKKQTPGKILAMDEAVHISTGDGIVQISKCRTADGTPMPFSTFLRDGGYVIADTL